MTGQQETRPLIDKIDAREAALAGEAEEARARIAELTARLRELDEAIGHLRITRKTLLAFAGEDPADPAPPTPALPGHPAYQQILTIFADAGRPMRARDLCQALDLPIIGKNTENIRSKLKRLVSRGILTETEPACSPNHAPNPDSGPLTSPPHPTPTTKRTSTRESPSQKVVPCRAVSWGSLVLGRGIRGGVAGLAGPGKDSCRGTR